MIQRRETKEERHGPGDAIRSQSQATQAAPRRTGQEGSFFLEPSGGGQSHRDPHRISGPQNRRIVNLHC